jgi:hypothetical protein
MDVKGDQSIELTGDSPVDALLHTNCVEGDQSTKRFYQDPSLAMAVEGDLSIELAGHSLIDALLHQLVEVATQR